MPLPQSTKPDSHTSQCPTPRPPREARRSGLRAALPNAAYHAVARVVDKFDSGDFLGALVLAAELFAVLRVPFMLVPPGRVVGLDLDHREGFVVSLVDGRSSLESMIDLSGMSMVETLRIVCRLIEARVIGMSDPSDER